MLTIDVSVAKIALEAIRSVLAEYETENEPKDPVWVSAAEFLEDKIENWHEFADGGDIEENDMYAMSNLGRFIEIKCGDGRVVKYVLTREFYPTGVIMIKPVDPNISVNFNARGASKWRFIS